MQSAMQRAAHNTGGVVLLSPTGSGKTLAFLLPLLHLINATSDTLQAVVITPTRELASQDEDVLKRMKTGLRSVSLYGGRPAMQEHRVLKEVRPHLVFATPGRLVDHLEKDNLNGYGVRLLIIDEFDKCLELGFQSEMEQALRNLPAINRLWLTSATDADDIPAFVGRFTAKNQRLDFLEEREELASRTELFEVKSEEKDKLMRLGELLTHLGDVQSIIFVNHRESVERIGGWLAAQGFSAAIYHGGMEQEWRERALYKFRNGSALSLVSTDLAARGLDIPAVGAVIHYHLPLKEEDFTHRNGRTARWQSAGAIYLITGPTEQLPEFASDIPLFNLPALPLCPVSPRYATLYIGRGKRDKLSRADIVGFLCKKGGISAEHIGRIDVGAHASYVAIWRTDLKKLLHEVAGEKIKGMKTHIEEAKK